MLTGRLIETTRRHALATPGVRRYKLAASLIHKGKIVCAKGNSRKTHPIQLKYAPYPYLHAESHCIIGYGLDNCAGLDILVVRVDANGDLAMSFPCPHCYELCKKVGISNIYYVDWDRNIQKYRIIP